MKRARDEEGTLIPLIAFYFVVAATLVLIVADASKYYLARQSLQNAADGAALASAQQVSGPGLYGGVDRGTLHLGGDVCQAVADYGNSNRLAQHFDRLMMTGYPDDDTGECSAAGAVRVTVVATDVVSLPLVGILGVIDDKFKDGAPLTVVAHAELRCATC